MMTNTVDIGIKSNNYNILWATLIVEELVRNGIDYFCISTGSRSTPLAYAVAKNPRAKSIICYDERGAAFHGLGYARSAGRPAVLICTSGTAAANYLPAVVEADSDFIPMIILSADRPPELQKAGANQTINQTDIFSSFARWKFNLPCPGGDIGPAFVLTTMDQAVSRAAGSPPGPVHINCMFREPLSGGSDEIPPAYLNSINNWIDSDNPYTKYMSGLKDILSDDLAEIHNVIYNIVLGTGKGIIIAGRLGNQPQAEEVKRLAKYLRWPMFPDVLSGLRFINRKYIINYFDQVLLSDSPLNNAPDTVLHFGGQPVSKRLLEYLGKIKPKNYILVADHPGRHDPNHLVTHRVEADIESFCLDLSCVERTNFDYDYVNYWKELSNTAHTIIGDYTANRSGKFNEIQVANIISDMIPESEGLFLASSMPVRDMDMYGAIGLKYGPPGSRYISTAGNRGASGIDGIIASACGFACGRNSGVTLVSGDLSALHDINSLDLVPKCSQRIIIIIINNGGGGIFSYLPISENKDVFDEFWTAPHEYHFESFANGFGIEYCHCDNPGEFTDRYKTALDSDSSIIIEIAISSNDNVEAHKKLQSLNELPRRKQWGINV